MHSAFKAKVLNNMFHFLFKYVDTLSTTNQVFVFYTCFYLHSWRMVCWSLSQLSWGEAFVLHYVPPLYITNHHELS